MGYFRKLAFANSCENTSSQLLFAPLSKLLSELLTLLMKGRQTRQRARSRLVLSRPYLSSLGAARRFRCLYTSHSISRSASDTCPLRHVLFSIAAHHNCRRTTLLMRFYNHALASPLHNSERFFHVYGKFNFLAHALRRSH